MMIMITIIKTLAIINNENDCDDDYNDSDNDNYYTSYIHNVNFEK